MKYVYPVIFEDAEEGGYVVTVPDIPCCFTQGEDMADAIFMAEDVIAMMLAEYEDEGKPVPTPSKIEDVKTTGIVSLVRADTDEWRKLVDNKAVKKTLSIPGWLNRKAERAAINFSQTLQDALCQKLGVSL
ncbi:MAG: type II toxin-antitoxin system HicB family antitoxin [Treponema sp.]|nr:type II toxin-antitoxin system HicB family antitoxin [Treponema sp.]